MDHSGVPIGITVCRCLVLLTGSLTLGLPAALLSLALRPVGAPSLLDRFRKDAFRVAFVAGVVDLVAAATWFVIASGSIADSWNTLCGHGPAFSLSGQTELGWALPIHAALIVGFLASFAVREATMRMFALVFFAFEGTCVLAWTGQAFELSDAYGSLPLAIDIVHRLSASLWSGSLVALLLASSSRGSATNDSKRSEPIVTGILASFNIASATVLFVSGICHAILFAGDVPHLIGTNYGRSIVVKTIFLAAALLLGLIYQMSTGQFAELPAHGKRSRLVHRRAIEMTLACLAVVLSAFLTGTHPAAHQEPVWPLPIRLEGGAFFEPGVAFETFKAGFLSAIGIGLLIFSATQRGLRLPVGLAGLMLTFVFVPAIFQSMIVPAYPTTFQSPPSPDDTSSIMRGWDLYRGNCASCHGGDFKGSGAAAAALSVRAADLTAAHVLAHPLGDLFWWIGNGIPDTPMPGFAATLSDADRWYLVEFVRILPDNGLNEVVGPNSLPAPDFFFDKDGRRERSSERIGKKGLILVNLDASAPSRLAKLAEAKDGLEMAGIGILAVTAKPAGTQSAFAFVGSVDSSVLRVYDLIARNSGTASEFLIDQEGFIRSIWRSDKVRDWNAPGVPQRLADNLSAHVKPKQALTHIH